jgi:hypothetical protein
MLYQKEIRALKEFRFKILREGDCLYGLTGNEIVIVSDDGGFRIYKMSGFDSGEPNFFKDFEEVTIHKEISLPENVAVVKTEGQYRIYKVSELKNGLPVFDDSFCVVLKQGIGKLQVFDVDSEVTITLPAKEGK